MGDLARINELLNQPAMFWALVALLFIFVSYSVFQMAKNYVLLAEMKKKKAALDAELSQINAKLEGLKTRFTGKRMN